MFDRTTIRNDVSTSLDSRSHRVGLPWHHKYLLFCADDCSVTDLLPLDTPDEPYFYTFKVQCTSCRETHPNWISVSRHVRTASAAFPDERAEKARKKRTSLGAREKPISYGVANPAKLVTTLTIYFFNRLNFI